MGTPNLYSLASISGCFNCQGLVPRGVPCEQECNANVEAKRFRANFFIWFAVNGRLPTVRGRNLKEWPEQLDATLVKVRCNEVNRTNVISLHASNFLVI